MIMYVAPTPDVTFAAPVRSAPALVTECIAPTRVAPSFSDLVNPQFSATCVEASAPKVIGSLIFAPVSQAHQEQIAARETTQNIVRSFCVIEEQIGDTPVLQIMEDTVEVVLSLPRERVPQRSVDQEQSVAKMTTLNIARSQLVQEQTKVRRNSRGRSH